MVHASIPATMATPSASTNTGSEDCTRQPPHDSVTSPVWSAIHAAPAAASAIDPRNRMIRYIEILLPRLGEPRHGISRELTGRGKRGVARICLVEPGLDGSTIGRRQRLQFAPRFGEIIMQRRRRDPRNHRATIVADGVTALDANQFCRARLQAIDDATAPGRALLRP